MSSTQQQIQGLLSQYTQGNSRKMSVPASSMAGRQLPVGTSANSRPLSVATSASRQVSAGTSLLVPINASRKHERSPSAATPERPKKRIKLEQKPPKNRETAELRQVVTTGKVCQMMEIKKKYRESLIELFFLQSMGNMVDYTTWRRKPDAKLMSFIRSSTLDSDDEWASEQNIVGESRSRSSTPVNVLTAPALNGAGDQSKVTKSTGLFGQYVNNQKAAGDSNSSVVKSSAGENVSFVNNKQTVSSVNINVVKSEHDKSAATSVLKTALKVNGTKAVEQVKTEPAANSQEAIVERAKQEAATISKVSELRKGGLWSSRKLPKVQEPSRTKSHWDYLLEEMAWMAADFAQERRWKREVSRKVAHMISMYHKQQREKAAKNEKNDLLQTRQISSNIAKMVGEFWSNIGQMADCIHRHRLQGRKKKTLDIQMDFLAQSSHKHPSFLPSSPKNMTSAYDLAVNSSQGAHLSQVDDSSLDQDSNIFLNVADLDMQAHLPVQELILELPNEYRTKNEPSKSEQRRRLKRRSRGISSSDDDEETMEIEERDHQYSCEEAAEEIASLKSEAKIPIAELSKKYSSGYESGCHSLPMSQDLGYDSESWSSESEDEHMTWMCSSESSNDDEVATLTDDAGPDTNNFVTDKSPSKDIHSITSHAQNIFPANIAEITTGFSEHLAKIPELFKGKLRDYQVVGYNWLVDLFTKELNGILADESGLGKTLQTIAFLTHLAVEKELWGPHLVVVPTGDVIKWEMVLKKFSPAFKVLTYFGTRKDLKVLKLADCSHVKTVNLCITSYKLLLKDMEHFAKKKWKYLILDDLQNLKNYKASCWKSLLCVNSQRKLVLLNAVDKKPDELWFLLQLILPSVFKSHSHVREWFTRSVGGIEGSVEYNDALSKKLLRTIQPFILQRTKRDMRNQIPKAHEQRLKCSLSTRQKFLYNDFISRETSKETLSNGQFKGVLSILMTLRKICDHPDLIEERPVSSPFVMERINFGLMREMFGLTERGFLENIVLSDCVITRHDSYLPHFAAHRTRRLQLSSDVIEDIENQADPLSRLPVVDKPLKLVFHNTSPLPGSGRCSPFVPIHQRSSSAVTVKSGVEEEAGVSRRSPAAAAAVVLGPGSGSSTQPTSTSAATTVAATSTAPATSQPITVQIQNTPQGTRLMIPSGQLSQLPGYIQIVQTSSGQQIIATSQPPANPSTAASIMTESSSTATYTTASTTAKPSTSIQLPISSYYTDKPTMKVSPLSKEIYTTSAGPTVSTTKAVPGVRSSTSAGPVAVILSDHNRATSKPEILHRIAVANKKNCEVKPIFGQDLIEAVNVLGSGQNSESSRWRGMGYVHCCKMQNLDSRPITWRQTNTLHSIVTKPIADLVALRNVLDRHAATLPKAVTKVHQSSAALFNRKIADENNLKCMTQKLLNFPRKALLQKDSGKMQRLSLLLQRLRKGCHKVVLYSQMIKMLDILEAFLDHQHYLYLRVDGNTKVDQRQSILEQFNDDKQIFVLLASTRLGRLNMDINNADSVIFYDEDWNPSMYSQVQNQCDKMCQKKDIHVYRLVSENTVEDKLVEPAEKKKLLCDIVGFNSNNLDSAMLQSSAMNDLFHDSVLDLGGLFGKRSMKTDKSPTKSLSDADFERMLELVEETDDVEAAKTARTLATAKSAEFEDCATVNCVDDMETESLYRDRVEVSEFEKGLTPIERYAIAHFERNQLTFGPAWENTDYIAVNQAKQQWEFDRAKGVQAEEMWAAEFEEVDIQFTYDRDDAVNSVFKNIVSEDKMPMWAPPTPPQDENDVYIDTTMCFLYEQTVMTEIQLPPVYIKKENKRARIDPAVAVTRKHKVRKEEQARVPKSLFDRPTSLLRRDAKLKLKQGFGMKQLKPSPMLRPAMDTGPEHPEWLIHEDWALLQSVQNMLELPLTLCTGSPAHIPNWDLVADVVNSSSRTYRAPKQCKYRYETIIVPREEGRILYDVNPRKQKKTKGIYKVYHTKNNRPMKTCHLYAQDNNQALSTLYGLRFDSCKCIASKRTPTMRPTLANPTLKNPKHAAVLGENGISYEQPLAPVQVAHNRAERIAKEKKEQLSVQKTLVVQQSTSSVAATAAAQTATVVTQTVAGAPQLTVVQAHHPQLQQLQQLQGVVTAAGTTIGPTIGPAVTLQKTATVSAVSLAKGLGATGSIVVNAAGGANAFATINRKQLTGQTVVGSLAQNIVTTSAPTASTLTAVRAAPARTIATSMTVQQLSAAIANQVRQNQSTPQVLPTTSLSRVSALPQSHVATSVQQKFAAQGSAKITPQHLLMLQTQQRQQQQLKQRSIGNLSQIPGQGQVQTATVQRSTVPVSAPLITSISGALTQQATRLQVPKQALTQARQRTLTEADMAVILRQKNTQRIQTISGASQQVQQVQVSGQGAMARLTSGQLISNAQQLAAQSGASSQPVATLVKSVSAQGGNNPSVTIPVSLSNLVQQKAVQGRMAPLQVRPIVGPKKTVTATQLQAKVATLGGVQLPRGIMPPKGNQQVIVQQIQQLVNHQSQAQNAANAATVIATQLVTSAGQTVARLSMPAGSSNVRTLAPPNANISSVGAVAPQTLITQTSNPSTVTLNQGVNPAIVKNLQEVVVSPNKVGLAQSMKTIPQASAIRGIQGAVAVNPVQAATVAGVQQLQTAAKQAPPAPSTK